MNKIFDLVYRGLKWLSKLTGLTYEEVNIIIWFAIIPAIFVCLLDWLLKSKYFKIGFTLILIIVVIVIPDFEIFSKALFQKSVDFLNWFEFLGINYIQSSVLICVIVPLLITGILLFLKKSRS